MTTWHDMFMRLFNMNSKFIYEHIDSFAQKGVSEQHN